MMPGINHTRHFIAMNKTAYLRLMKLAAGVKPATSVAEAKSKPITYKDERGKTWFVPEPEVDYSKSIVNEPLVPVFNSIGFPHMSPTQDFSGYDPKRPHFANFMRAGDTSVSDPTKWYYHRNNKNGPNYKLKPKPVAPKQQDITLDAITGASPVVKPDQM